MAGQSWRVLMALTALSAGTHYARVGLCWHGGSGVFWPVWWGEETAISGASVYDLGAVQIPPDTASDVWIILHIRSGTSGTATLDFLQLQPAENHRYIRQTFGLSDGDALIDDGVQGYVYYYSSSANYPVTIGYGSPLEIYPGRTQRLRVMWSLAGDLGTTLEAQAWYRPRRLTV